MDDGTIRLLIAVVCPLFAVVLAIGAVYTLRQTHEAHHVREALKLFAAAFVAALLAIGALVPGLDVMK